MHPHDPHPAATILIVDDDEDIRGLFGELLRLEGWSVEEAADGHAALARIQARAPDLVLLDQRMPGLSGLEVAEVLARRGPAPPVILMSGARERPAAAIGVTLFLAKPFGLAELLEQVRRALPRGGLVATASAAQPA